MVSGDVMGSKGMGGKDAMVLVVWRALVS